MTISFSGLASGLDTSSWVQSLTALKQAKVTTLETQREELVLQKSTLQSIRSFFASFRSTVEKITDSRFNIASMDLFAQNLATSANVEKLTATATHEALEATYEIGVNNLATKTQAVSGNRYSTTTDVTETATNASLLKNIGINAGRILVTNPVNGIQGTVRIEENDTLETFIEKLEKVGGGGIDANYDPTTGIFSINLDESDIVDLDGTNIKSRLNLEDVSEGYFTSTLTSELMGYKAADGLTKLFDIGVQAGTISLQANGGTYLYTIDSNTTFDSLIGQFAANNITASIENGFFKIENAYIASEGTTNFKAALGLEDNISGQLQASDALKYQTTTVTTTVADKNTKLSQIGTGQTINTGSMLFVTNSNNQQDSMSVDENTTIGDLLNFMNAAGLNATIDTEGVVHIMGGTISSSGFDVHEVLNLTEDPYSGAVTGKPLNHTVEVYELVTLNTKLVDDLEVKEGFIQVMDENNTKRYLEISNADTIGTLITKLGKMGIYAELDESTGILTITGGKFDEVSDGVIQADALHEDLQNKSTPLQSSNLLTLLYNSPTISASNTQVASTYARSNVLRKAVVNNIVATGDTNMDDLGITGETITIKDDTGTIATIDLTADMTITQLVGLINTAGSRTVTASFDATEGILSLENGYIENAVVEKKLGLKRDVEGTSHVTGLLREETVRVFATQDTLFSQLNIADGTKLTVHKADGTTEEFAVGTNTPDLRSMFNWLATKGVNASISDGVISLTSSNGHYVDGDLAVALGISIGEVGNTHTFGTPQTSSGEIIFTTTNVATTDTYLKDIIGIDVMNAMTDAERTVIIKDQALYDHVSGTYDTPIGTFIVSKTATLGDLLNALSGYGMSVNLDNGVIKFDNFNGIYAVDGVTEDANASNDENGILEKLGIGYNDEGDISLTVGVITTSSVLTTYTDDITATELSVLVELEDCGITASDTLIVNDANGDAVLGTFTINNTTTIGEMLNWLSSKGVLASIDSDGKLKVEQGNKYLTGNIATKLGISNAKGTNNTVGTVGTTMTSTSQVLYTGSYAADATTYLSDLGVEAGDTLTIKTANSETGLATYTAATTDTVATLLSWLTSNNNVATINNGVISVNNGDKMIVGDVADALGITSGDNAGDQSITYKTVGAAITSSVALKYTGTDKITATSMLEDIALTNKIVGTDTLTIYNAGSTATSTTFAADDKSVGDLINFLVANSIAASLTDDGKIQLETSVNFVKGTLATKLGITSPSKSVTTTTVGKTMTSSAQLQYTGTGLIEATTLLKDISGKELSGKSLTIMNAGGNATDKIFTADDSTTVVGLLSWLTSNGNTATLSGGKITVTNGNYYLAGELATGLGIASDSNDDTITTVTTAVTQTGSAVTYDKVTTADENTKLKDLGITFATGDYALSYAGETSGNITGISGDSTIGDVLAKINAVDGLNAGISNGQIIITTSNNTYITGKLADKLGIDHGSNEYGDRVTIGVGYTSSTAVKETITIMSTTKLKDMGVTSAAYNLYTIKKDNTSAKVETKNWTTDLDNATINDFVTWLNKTDGYNATFSNGTITVTAGTNNGTYYTGDVFTKLGISLSSTCSSTLQSATIASTAGVKYGSVYTSTTTNTVTSTITSSDAVKYQSVSSSTTTNTTTTTVSVTVTSTGAVTYTSTKAGSVTYSTSYVRMTDGISFYDYYGGEYFNNSWDNLYIEVKNTSGGLLCSQVLTGSASASDICKYLTDNHVGGYGASWAFYAPTDDQAFIYCGGSNDGSVGSVIITTYKNYQYMTIADSSTTGGGGYVGLKTMQTVTSSTTSASTTTVTMTASTTFSTFGSPYGSIVIKNSSGTALSTISLSSTSSISSINSSLSQSGYGSATVSNGKVTITAAKGYIIDLSGMAYLKSRFYLNGSEAKYYTTSNTTTTTVYTTNTVDITSSTSFGRMGVAASSIGSIVVKDSSGNVKTTINIVSGNTISDINSSLGSYGDASVSNGKVTITARDGYIIDVSGMIEAARTKLKLNRTDAKNYKTYTTNYHTTQVAITTSVTFDKMGHTGNLGKIVVKDENGSAVHTVSVTGSSTLGGINTALGNFGDVAVASDGKVTITARLGYQVDVSGLNDTVETYLKLNKNLAKNFYTYSWTNSGDTNDTKKVSYTLNNSTTLEQLGIAVNQTIKRVDINGSDDATFTVQADDLTKSVVDYLNGLDLKASFSVSGNKLIMTTPEFGYRVEFSSGIKDKLDLAGDGYQMVGADETVYYNTPSDTLSDNSKKALNMSTKLSELGITSNHTIKTKQGNVTATKDWTIKTLFEKLGEKGIVGSLSADGKVTLSAATASDYIYVMSDTLAGKLGLTATDTAYYSTSESTVWATETSANAMIDAGTKVAHTGLMLSQLSSSSITDGNKLIKYINNGTAGTITVTKSTTIDSLITSLGTAGFNASLGADGKLTISPSSRGNFITEFDAEVAAALKLATGTSNYYDDAMRVTVWNATTTASRTDAGTKTAIGSVTMGQLGLNDNNNHIIDTINGNITVTKSTTLNDLMTALRDKGLSASLGSDGKLSISPSSDGNYIETFDATLAGVLKLSVTDADLYSSSTVTVWATETSGVLIDDGTKTIKIGTTIGDLDSDISAQKIVVKKNNDSVGATITITATNTIYDVFDKLDDYRIQGAISQDGKIVFTQNGEYYITSVTDDLAAALDLKNDAGSLYVMNTIYYSKTSGEHDWNDPDAYINFDMTLDEIGVGNGTITIWSEYENGRNGGAVTVDYTSSDRLGDLLNALREKGIESAIEDGHLKLFPQKGYYITSDIATSGNTFFSRFNLSIREDGTYDTTEYNEFKNTNSSALSFSILKTINSSTTFDDLELSTGCTFSVYANGTNVEISMTKDNTLGDLAFALSGAGISTEIRNGKLFIKGSENSYITKMDSSFATRLEISTNIDDYSDERQDYTTVNTNSNILKRDEVVRMTDSTLLSTLGINSGNIILYNNGVTSTIAIDNTLTVADFKNQLAAYNITSSIVDGKLSLSAAGIVWLADDTSNLVYKLGLGYDNWQKGSYSQASTFLGDTEDDTELATSDTKLADLLDSTGTNNINVGTGEYVIYKDGYRSTETITEDTTVGDFISTLGTYGLTANLNNQGQIEVGGTGNTYLAKSGSANAANIENLIAYWDFNNIYTSNNLEIPDPISVAITETTKLSEINNAAGQPGDYKAGVISVVQNGVQTNFTLMADDTVGALMAQLELYGLDCAINDAGQVIVKSNGDTYIKDYTGADRSNALDILGINESNWIKTNVYDGDAVTVTTSSTDPTAAVRETQLKLLGVDEGEYYIYKDGVRYTALISSDETVGSFLDTLASFGIQGNIKVAADGKSSQLFVNGSGDSYIATSNSTNNRSNVVNVLLPSSNNTTDYNYVADLTQKIEDLTRPEVTLDTLLTDVKGIDDVAVVWTDDNVKAQGIIAVTVDGQNFNINVEQNDTFRSLFDKFEAVGISATLNNGVITLQGGFSEIAIDEANTTSDIYRVFGFTFDDDMGGFAASSMAVTQTTQRVDDHNDSISRYADYNTKLNQLNITSGTLSVYKNGQKASIQVDADETFTQLRTKITSALTGVDIAFEDGYLKFFSTTGDSVEVGSTTDTSNLVSVCGLFNDKSGTVTSARELFKVNGTTKLMDTNLFSAGDITAGTFIIGNAIFTIDENTTVNGLISQINGSEEANATAFWDSIDGKFIIESRATGSSLINIEKGTSNITDIFGFTVEGQNRMDVSAQEIGQNASFTINGTNFTSSSNTVGSDITRLTGVTINLKEITNGETVTLTIERDKETVANAMSDIVDAYNELLTNVDKEIARGGTLSNQSTLKMLRNQIRSLMTSSIAGASVFKNLDQIGITVEAASGANISTTTVDTLYFDKDKFLKAFNADRDAVRNMLVGSDSTNGIFSQIENILESSLSGAYGYFDSANRNFNDQIQRLDTKIDKTQAAVDKYKLRLEAKFSVMDRLIANMQNQYSSFLG